MALAIQFVVGRGKDMIDTHANCMYVDIIRVITLFTWSLSFATVYLPRSAGYGVAPAIMGSPSSSARLTLLPSNYLSSQNPSSEITLQSLIDVSDRMANEAKEALPYNFDECSYNKGYLRQSVWSCLGAFRSKERHVCC